MDVVHMSAEATKMCTCPNCQVKFKLEVFNDHVSTCERTEGHEFPKYRVKVSGKGIDHSRYSFQSLSNAATMFMSGSLQVDIGKRVLESDYSLRPIVDAERHLISEIADKIEASK